MPPTSSGQSAPMTPVTPGHLGGGGGAGAAPATPGALGASAAVPAALTPGTLRGTLTPVGLPPVGLPRTPPDPTGERQVKRQRHSDHLFPLVKSAISRGALEESAVLLERYQASLSLERLDGTRLVLAAEQHEAFQALLLALREGTLAAAALAAPADGARLVRLLMWVSGQGSVLRMQDEQGRTALHVALYLGHHPAATLLLDLNADPSVRSHAGLLPLHEAVSYGGSCSEALLRRLAGEGLVWLSARDGKDRTALQLAAAAGDPATIALLLDLGAEPGVQDCALLHASVRSMSSPPCSGVLMRGVLAALAGPGLVFLDAQDSSGMCALHIALEAERPAVAAALVDLGADVSVRSGAGYLALHIATWSDRVWEYPGVVSLLTRLAGRDLELLNAQDEEGCTALHLALAAGSTDIAGHLLDLGASVCICNHRGYLALHLAVWYGRPTRELLQRLAGPGLVHLACRDAEGCTPLHIALKAQCEATAAALIELRSDVTARDSSGRLPLHVAAARLELCSVSLVRSLCGEGGARDLIDLRLPETGRTALHEAAWADNEGAAAALLELECDPGLRDDAGRTPLGLALEQDSESIVALLQRRGQEPAVAERGVVTSLLFGSLPPGLRWWETDMLSFMYSGSRLCLAQKQRLLREFGEERRAAGEHSAERLELVCRREAPMEELCDQLNLDVLAYGELEVVFRSACGRREAAVGQGLRQEWYTVVRDELADPDRALLASRDGGKTLDVNPHSGFNPDHLEHFRVLGKVVALALAYGENIDGLRFSAPLRKLLLGQELHADDIPGFDPELGRVLEEVNCSDVSCWGLYFEADLASMPFDPTGNLRERKERKAVELEPGGRQQEVTEENKARFVSLMKDKLLKDYLSGVSQQIAAIRAGMIHILGSHHIVRRMRQLLDHADLDLLLGGQAKVDVDAFEKEVEYAGCTADTEQVRWFWEEVRQLDEEGLARLLHFVTGSGSVPAGGFSMFSSYGSAHPRVTIVLEEAVRKTCRAATCFNTLYLPRYPTRASLAEGLILSIYGAAGFHEFEHP